MPHPDEARGLLLAAIQQVDPLAVAPASASLPSIASGTYLPTITNILNIAAGSITQEFSWLRIGNIVTVSGRIDITPTVGAGTQTEVRVSLPIPSTFVNAGDAAGVFAPISASTEVFGAFGLIAGSVMRVAGLAQSAAAVSLFGSFTYAIK